MRKLTELKYSAIYFDVYFIYFYYFILSFLRFLFIHLMERETQAEGVFLGKHHLKDELSKLVLVFLELAF